MLGKQQFLWYNEGYGLNTNGYGSIIVNCGIPENGMTTFTKKDKEDPNIQFSEKRISTVQRNSSPRGQCIGKYHPQIVLNHQGFGQGTQQCRPRTSNLQERMRDMMDHDGSFGVARNMKGTIQEAHCGDGSNLFCRFSRMGTDGSQVQEVQVASEAGGEGEGCCGMQRVEESSQDPCEAAPQRFGISADHLETFWGQRRMGDGRFIEKKTKFRGHHEIWDPVCRHLQIVFPPKKGNKILQNLVKCTALIHPNDSKRPWSHPGSRRGSCQWSTWSCRPAIWPRWNSTVLDGFE